MTDIERALSEVVGTFEAVIKLVAESDTAFDDMATIALNMFMACKNKGFNDEQAMQLTLAVVGGLVNSKK